MRTRVLLNTIHYLTAHYWAGIILSILLIGTPGFGSQNYNSDSANKMSAPEVEIKGKGKSDLSIPAMLLRDGKLTVNMPSTTLNEAMREFSRVTGIKVLWQREEINKPLELGFTGYSVEEAIEKMLYGESYMLSLSSLDGRQKITKITILPDSDNADTAVSHAKSPVRTDVFGTNEIDEEMMREWEIMEQARTERWNRLEEVRAISMLEDKEEASERLMMAIENNPDGEARLMALENLNEMAPVQTDTLIDTVSRDEDPRVKLRAIDLLVQRVDEDPSIEGFLTSFFENEMLKANQQF